MIVPAASAFRMPDYGHQVVCWCPGAGEDGLGDADPEGATARGSCTGRVYTAMPAVPLTCGYCVACRAWWGGISGAGFGPAGRGGLRGGGARPATGGAPGAGRRAPEP